MTRAFVVHLALLGIAGGLLGPAAAARAQSIEASAVVVGGNLQVVRERDLDFGNVIRGVPATIGFRDNRSGRLRITGTTGADVSLTFLLPTLLTVGSHSMPITFGPNSAGHWPLPLPIFATTFDPNVPAAARLLAVGRTGYLWVWIGGTVSPSLSQSAGIYTGNVTLVVSYTGI